MSPIESGHFYILYGQPDLQRCAGCPLLNLDNLMSGDVQDIFTFYMDNLIYRDVQDVSY
jgi:hypothetical protein